MLKNKLIMVFFLIIVQLSFSITEQRLVEVRDTFENRRDSMLKKQVGNPFPTADDPDNAQLFAWSKLNYALASFFLNVEIDKANQAVIDAAENSLRVGVVGEFGLHWVTPQLTRIYELFGSNSQYHPGRLSSQAQEAIVDVMWQWAKSQSKISDAGAQLQQLWFIWGSENHSAMRNAANWSAAKMFTENEPYNQYKYDDGSSPQQQYEAWNHYHIEYLKERIRKGLLVEIASTNYSAYTLQGWYNLYDFSENERLSKIAGYAIDLWWADWAQEQINAVRGGGKSRVAQGAQSLLSDHRECQKTMAWYYFNIGYPLHQHPNIMCLVTSKYRLPLVILDIALDIEGRGVYEAYSRRPGFGAVLPLKYDLPAENNAMDYNCGRIIKYSYCTPEFVLGCLMFEKKQKSQWPNISDQNRWQGLIFSDSQNSRIVPIAEAYGALNRNYNAHWAVQRKGTMIAQKLDTSHQAGKMRVFFSADLEIEKEGGWIFAKTQSSDAFAAVKVVQGDYQWQKHQNGWGNWIFLNEQYSPIIIEAARAVDYDRFDGFKSSVLNDCNLVIYNGIITYKGLSGSIFTFDIHGANNPLIDGEPIDFCPSYTFNSPFIQSDFGSDIVTISKGQREHIIDIR